VVEPAKLGPFFLRSSPCRHATCTPESTLARSLRHLSHRRPGSCPSEGCRSVL
jgi:hypothetical protein